MSAKQNEHRTLSVDIEHGIGKDRIIEETE